MLRTRVLTRGDSIETLRGAWKELFEAAPTATPFQSYAWQSTWWKHFGLGKRPYLIAIEEGDDLLGLMPMYRTAGPWRVLRPIGVGASDYLHPLARSGYEQEVAHAVAQELRDGRGYDLVDLHQIRESRPLASMAPGACIDQATCLLLELPKTYDAYLAMLGKSLRYDVRKLDKTLFVEGKASVQQVEQDEIALGMEILFEQHKRRWHKRFQPGVFLSPKVQRFHREWADMAIRDGWLWLSILRYEGNPIGAIYAMAAHDTCYYYQAGFDPEHGSISPGTLLVASTIRRAIAEGKRAFDFLRGDEPYKRRWKPQHVLMNRRFVFAKPGVRGEVGSSWNLAGSRVESRVRARLEGKGLL